MNKIKDNLPIILVSLSSILFVIAILLLINNNIFKTSNNVDSNDANSKDTKEVQKQESSKDKKQEVEKTNEKTKSGTDVPKETVVPTSTPTETITKSEENVINYFQTKESEIINSKELKEKAKDTFINVVDFIFYDKEIKGYKFKELTNTAKLKIISIALQIDNKIDSYFPSYKDKIKGTYTNIKAKLVEKYLEYSNKLCESVGEEKCNKVKEDFTILKEKFGITTEYLKKLGITGSAKLKTWYENFKDK